MQNFDQVSGNRKRSSELMHILSKRNDLKSKLKLVFPILGSTSRNLNFLRWTKTSVSHTFLSKIILNFLSVFKPTLFSIKKPFQTTLKFNFSYLGVSVRFVYDSVLYYVMSLRRLMINHKVYDFIRAFLLGLRSAVNSSN